MALLRDHSHGHDSSLLVSVPPIMAMLASCGSGRRSRTFFHYWNDFSSSLSNLCDERSVQIGIIIDNLSKRLSSNSCVESIRVLGCTVVSPNNDILNIFDFAAYFSWNLRQGSALIKSGHSSEVLLWDRWSVSRSDQSVSVGWVSNNANLHSFLSNFIESGSLSLEDFGISLEEISSFHSWSSWPCANENDNISILESNHRISSWDNRINASVGAVHQLHAQSLKRSFCLWELHQLHDHFLIWSKHSSLGDKMAQESSNLSGGSGHSNSNWSLLEVNWWWWEVSAQLLNSRN